MKFCRFLSMEGARFGLVESRNGEDVIVSELPSPQMQVSAAGVPEQIVLPDPGDMTGSDEVPGSEEKPGGGKRSIRPIRWSAPNSSSRSPSSARFSAWAATTPRTSANCRMR